MDKKQRSQKVGCIRQGFMKEIVSALELVRRFRCSVNGDVRRSIPDAKDGACSEHDTLAGTQEIQARWYFTVVLEIEQIYVENLKKYIVSATEC